MTSKRRNSDFTWHLPRLVTAYEQGRLVPFIGSGMSIPNCRPWDEFVHRLAVLAEMPAAGEEENPGPAIDSEALIRRVNAAVRSLKLRDPQSFVSNVRKALWTRKKATPRGTVELARLWWPLVLTTNYDDLFLKAFNKEQEPHRMEVLGRSESDCQRLLTALRMPSQALLWAVQGFLGGPADAAGAASMEHLASELVIGHQEYRRVTHRLLHFRRAFAEVYRQRQMLFLGSGLKEPYFRDLFGEIQEIYGPSICLHYAFIKAGEVDPDFMEANFQIRVIEYAEHEQVPAWIKQLREEVEKERFKPVRWSYAFHSDMTEASQPPSVHLELVRGALPDKLSEDECLALSAGGGGQHFFFSRSIQDLLKKMNLSTRSLKVLRPLSPESSPMIARFGDQPVYAVRARDIGDRYSLAVIDLATMEMLDTAASNGHKRILAQLFAAGGRYSDNQKGPSYQRSFPARFALIQMILGYARWRKAYRLKKNPPQLSIYIVDPSVFMEVASGRLDVLELLGAPDKLRFWVEINWPGGRVEHHMVDAFYNEDVKVIVDLYDIPRQDWEVEVIPPVRKDKNVFKLSDPLVWDDWIVSLGVVPGSTVRFRQAAARATGSGFRI